MGARIEPMSLEQFLATSNGRRTNVWWSTFTKIQQNQLILFNLNQQDQYYLTDRWQRMVVSWVCDGRRQYGIGSSLKKFVRKLYQMK